MNSSPHDIIAAPSDSQSTFRAACWTFIFYAMLVMLTLLALYPLWTNRLLPMQDYPQHLFLAHVLATFHDPGFNWHEYYAVNPGLRPYHLWYVLMKPLVALYGVETAGKILFSGYVTMISVLVVMSRRICPKGTLPWGALILFPCAFNQIYFMGFPNFIICLPILYLTMLDLEEMVLQGASVWRYGMHAACLVVLYLAHPYALLVYICLALTIVVYGLKGKRPIANILWLPVAAAVVLTLWYVQQHGPSTAPNPYVWHITWLPPGYSAVFYVLMFTGMRFTNGVDPVVLMAWLAIMMTAYVAWRSSGRQQDTTLPALLFLVTCAGYLVLPAWFGYYSYFNLRLAPVSYFLLALLFAHLNIKPKSGCIIAILVMVLMVVSLRTQAALSREAEEILPLTEKTAPNALVLPLVFSGGTAVIEPVFFYQFHLHQVSYYHIHPGGGANPTLFRNAMIPVQYRSDVRLPCPDRPEAFSWSEHGRYYRYFMLRGAPESFSRQLQLHATYLARSGAWELYENSNSVGQ